ncbi:MAG TPA: endolytic transglycosylase MltG [bacterium]|nr:endolytic transglycosylase MltG [bacterium]
MPPKTQQRKKTDPLRRIVFIALVTVMFCAGAGVLAIKHLWRDAPGRPTDPPAIVVIERGASLRSIAANLTAHGVIADARGFLLLAQYFHATTRIKAGEYAIAHGQPMRAVLEQLIDGRTVKHRFTVIPGETAATVADKLIAAGLDPKNEAHALLTDHDFLNQVQIHTSSLEGYLAPETYLYQRGDDARAMYKRMVEQFNRTWHSLSSTSADSERTKEQLVTLASIVEKESGYAPEMPKIARVFLNRLRAKIPLQADPSVIFAQGKDFKGRLTKAMLRADHPYNTYTRRGLPPGPICNPGHDALAAVLNPTDGDWLYFVADGLGRHVFSTTLEQHNEAVRKYRQTQK